MIIWSRAEQIQNHTHGFLQSLDWPWPFVSLTISVSSISVAHTAHETWYGQERMSRMKVVGLMSGTSADGVDAALVSIVRKATRLEVEMGAFYSLPYPRSLQQRLLSASVSGTVADLCHLNALLGEWFADAALGAIRAAQLPTSGPAEPSTSGRWAGTSPLIRWHANSATPRHSAA